MTFCAMSRAAKPREASVGMMPRLACVTVRRSRKLAQSMSAMDSASRVLRAQALVMRNGVFGLASLMANRFVSNADGLMFTVGALLLCGVAVEVVVTTSSRRLVNAAELTRGGFQARFLLMMRRSSSAVGVEVVGLSSAVMGRFFFRCLRFFDVAGSFSVVVWLRSPLLRRGSWAGT